MSDSNSFGSVVGSLVLVWAVFAAWDAVIHSKLRYSLEYNVPTSLVTKADKPHDCDTFAAPLGFKNCHYNPDVQVIRVNKDQNGNAIISYDNGKTWQWQTSPYSATPGVVVTWKKTEE